MSGWWMVCYDIADDKRRDQVAELLSVRGERVQYSVFECRLSSAELASLTEALREVIDAKEDTVRFYPLCAWCRQRTRWQGRRSEATLPAYQVV